MTGKDPRFKVLVTDYAWPSLDIERAILGRERAGLIVAETGSEPELEALASDADAILTCWKHVTPAVLDRAQRCQVVARYGVGLDNIAVEHATELGIVVTNVPEFCTDEVSEHVVALMLALRRKIMPSVRQTRNGAWDNTALRPIHRLRGQTLGVIGFGQLGRATATKGRALGMRVLAYSPAIAGRPPEPGVKIAASLEELLANSDVVSIHVPLTDDTRGLIDASALSLMKNGALLINTSRGAVIDSVALVQALLEGTIAGAGLDVLPTEPPERTEPLLTMDNVIVTPHAAFYSVESTTTLAQQAASSVAAILRGALPASVVNPAVLDKPRLRMAVGRGQQVSCLRDGECV